MKIFLILISSSVFASHLFLQIGWDKKGNRIFKRGNICFYVIDDEFEKKIDCKEVRKRK